MKVQNITASDYAKLYGCSTSFVRRNLRKGNELPGMIEFKKHGTSWIITVLESWYQSLAGQNQSYYTLKNKQKT